MSNDYDQYIIRQDIRELKVELDALKQRVKDLEAELELQTSSRNGTDVS